MEQVSMLKAQYNDNCQNNNDFSNDSIVRKKHFAIEHYKYNREKFALKTIL